jgi:hemerythrin-like domain-containing protein
MEPFPAPPLPEEPHHERGGEKPLGRRSLLVGLATGASAVGAAGAAWAKEGKHKRAEEPEEGIGPGEDLMREHGVLRRVLLVHAEILRGLQTAKEVDPQILQRTGKLIRSFVEDYHERQEEEFLFPRFERAGKLVPLVKTLRAQHRAGRAVTDRIVALATSPGVKDAGSRRQLAGQLESFTRMYEPHAAREDTVLFPALHELISHHEYDALGEEFERREKQVFHGDGFERAVAEVAAIEKLVGIDDLARFTPAPPGP